MVTDHTLAGRSGAYRSDGPAWPGGYDPELLAHAGLRPEQLPAVSAPGARLAPGASAGWAAHGLPAGAPVLVAGHDHAVGAWAAGARLPGQAADSIGTAEAIYLVMSDGPPRSGALEAAAGGAARRALWLEPSRLEAVRAQGISLAATLDGAPALLAGHSTAGGAVEWWLAHRAGALDANGLATLAAQGWPPPDDLLVLPYPNGRQCPRPDPGARLAVLQEREHSPAETAAALFDGLALHAAWMLQAQLRAAGLPQTGIPQADLSVLGGPAMSNPVWMAAKSRVFPSAAAVVQPEPVAVGAALFALAQAEPSAGPPGGARLASRPLAPGREARADADPSADQAGARLDQFITAATRTAIPKEHS
jgi:sugar (pentulose or hexulose) kinase